MVFSLGSLVWSIELHRDFLDLPMYCLLLGLAMVCFWLRVFGIGYGTLLVPVFGLVIAFGLGYVLWRAKRNYIRSFRLSSVSRSLFYFLGTCRLVAALSSLLRALAACSDSIPKGSNVVPGQKQHIPNNNLY